MVLSLVGVEGLRIGSRGFFDLIVGRVFIFSFKWGFSIVEFMRNVGRMDSFYIV